MLIATPEISVKLGAWTRPSVSALANVGQGLPDWVELCTETGLGAGSAVFLSQPRAQATQVAAVHHASMARATPALIARAPEIG